MENEIKALILEMADLYLREANGDPEEAVKRFERYQTITGKWVSAAIKVIAKRESLNTTTIEKHSAPIQ